MAGVPICGHPPEFLVTFGRGGPHIVWSDPLIDHRTSLETICNVLEHIHDREAYWNAATPWEWIIHKGAIPGISDKLGDKSPTGGRGGNVASQERKICIGATGWAGIFGEWHKSQYPLTRQPATKHRKIASWRLDFKHVRRSDLALV